MNTDSPLSPDDTDTLPHIPDRADISDASALINDQKLVEAIVAAREEAAERREKDRAASDIRELEQAARLRAQEIAANKSEATNLRPTYSVNTAVTGPDDPVDPTSVVPRETINRILEEERAKGSLPPGSLQP